MKLLTTTDKTVNINNQKKRVLSFARLQCISTVINVLFVIVIPYKICLYIFIHKHYKYLIFARFKISTLFQELYF